MWETALAELRDAGAELIDPVDLEMPSRRTRLEVLLHEFHVNINEYLREVKTPESPGSLSELIEFNERNSDRELMYWSTTL